MRKLPTTIVPGIEGNTGKNSTSYAGTTGRADDNSRGTGCQSRAPCMGEQASRRQAHIGISSVLI